jgi:cytosine/adenosine deaminase-related metal-dependent hydrolase
MKHKLLHSTDQNTIKEGMHGAILEMETYGTTVFVDFRENGIIGSLLLQEAAENTNVTPIIFGRPQSLIYDEEELIELFNVVDGIGLSSISDWEEDQLESVVSLAKKNNIPISFHASESIREDIEQILSYNPCFLIHMTSASKHDLVKVKEAEVPVVICPRSNGFFGLSPPLRLMKESEVEVLIGTDNAMIHSPCILDEIKYILEKFPNVFTLEQLMIKATYGARKALNLKDGIPGASFPSSFVVLEPKTLQVISTSVGC